MTTGFEEIEALVTLDILRRGGVYIQSVSLTGDRKVSGGHQISVIADLLFEEVDFTEAKMLILPGGTVKINEHDGLKREILACADQGKLIAAICAAPMVLGGLGLLKDKKATCYPGYEKYLNGAQITGTKVEVAGNIISSKAAGYTFDFAFNLLSQLKGHEMSEETAEKIFP